MAAQPIQSSLPLRHLPLVTLCLSERCNSRCVSCDYWRNGRADLDLAAVERLLPSLAALETRVALVTGGEPLLNREWPAIAERLRASGLKLWLLTSGLSLAKHAARAAQLFDAITVSLDASDRDTYAAIRGVHAFDNVCEGVRAVAQTGTPLAVRTTVQRANFRQLPELIDLASDLGARQISFVAVDIANPHAFGRAEGFSVRLALEPDELPVLAHIIERLERERAADFRSGLIADSPRKLWGLHRYFAAVCGLGPYPPVHCNVFDYSAVLDARGRVSPCFFIPGPQRPADGAHGDLAHILNTQAMMELRAHIRSGERPECARCVCSLWREPAQRGVGDFLMHRSANA